MKSEIFAVSLLRISPRAQKLFLDLFGDRMSAADFDLIRYLAQPEALEDLREHFRCQREDVFSELVEKINLDALEKPASVRFTRKHLANIMEQTKVIQYLTNILQCDQNEIFDEIFDIPKVLDYLYNISPQVVKQWLFVHIQEDRWAHPGKLIFKYLLQANLPHISDREWDHFLEDNQWFRSTAMAKIRGALADQGYLAITDSKSLATLIEESFYLDVHNGVYFDSLAVLHIQRQIAWIVRQMIDHALEQLDNALRISNSAETFVNLQKHLEAYEMKHPAAVWADILNFTVIENITKVKEFIVKYPSVTVQSTGAQGIPEIGIKMTIRQEKVSLTSSEHTIWSWRKRKSALQIVMSCKLIDKAESTDVLICVLEDSLQCNLFMRALSDLQFISVEKNVAFDIGNFILSQSRSSNIHDHMKYLLSKLRPVIIQGLILTGCDIPNLVVSIWDRELEIKLPIQKLQHTKDTKFPLDRKQILQTIQDDSKTSDYQIVEEID